MSSLNANKVGALFTFFGVSFIGVWTPYFIPVRPLVLKFGLLFSSGLFIALAFLHMVNECVHVFSEYFTGDYPLGFLIPPLGFYMTWLADIIAQSIWSKRSRKAAMRSTSSQKVMLENTDSEGQKEVAKEQPGEASSAKTADGGEAESEDPLAVGSAFVAMGGVGEKEGAAMALSLLDVIALLVALCCHAFFEGLAVGLASSVYDVWNLTLSICINEFFEGAALGTTLRAQDTSRRMANFMLYAVGASIVAPIGIAIGMILNDTVNHDAAEWAEGIGNGLAAGVFICVATRHLINKAMVPEGPTEPVWMPFLKFFVSGLGLMVNSLTTLRAD